MFYKFPERSEAGPRYKHHELVLPHIIGDTNARSLASTYIYRAPFKDKMVITKMLNEWNQPDLDTTRDTAEVIRPKAAVVIKEWLNTAKEGETMVAEKFLSHLKGVRSYTYASTHPSSSRIHSQNNTSRKCYSAGSLGRGSYAMSTDRGRDEYRNEQRPHTGVARDSFCQEENYVNRTGLFNIVGVEQNPGLPTHRRIPDFNKPYPVRPTVTPAATKSSRFKRPVTAGSIKATPVKRSVSTYNKRSIPPTKASTIKRSVSHSPGKTTHPPIKCIKPPPSPTRPLPIARMRTPYQHAHHQLKGRMDIDSFKHFPVSRSCSCRPGTKNVKILSDAPSKKSNENAFGGGNACNRQNSMKFSANMQRNNKENTKNKQDSLMRPPARPPSAKELMCAGAGIRHGLSPVPKTGYAYFYAAYPFSCSMNRRWRP